MIRTEFMMITISMLCLEILMALAPEKINTAVIADETNTVETLWRECELTWDEVPVDGYFVNAYQRHYNHCWEDYAAYIVVDYASSAGLEKEQWELKQIYHFRDDIYQVYTESDRKSFIKKLYTKRFFSVFILTACVSLLYIEQLEIALYCPEHFFVI